MLTTKRSSSWMNMRKHWDEQNITQCRKVVIQAHHLVMSHKQSGRDWSKTIVHHRIFICLKIKVSAVPIYSFPGKGKGGSFVCACVHRMYVALFLSRQNERMKLNWSLPIAERILSFSLAGKKAIFPPIAAERMLFSSNVYRAAASYSVWTPTVFRAE